MTTIFKGQKDDVDIQKIKIYHAHYLKTVTIQIQVRGFWIKFWVQTD